MDTEPRHLVDSSTNEGGDPEKNPDFQSVQQERSMANHVRDGLMNVWLHFRTGSQADDPTGCMYVEMQCKSSPQDKVVSAHAPVMERVRLPPKKPEALRFVVVSDTHSRHESLGALPPCDIFIHTGDILMSSRLWSSSGCVQQYQSFNQWLGSVPCPLRVVIGGNHDRVLESIGHEACSSLLSNSVYLENSFLETTSPSGRRILLFGSPTSGGHSRNSAFQSPEFSNEASSRAKEASRKAATNDGAAVVLLTHGPARHLRKAFGEVSLKAHLWGHAHAAHGAKWEKAPNEKDNLLSLCTSIMDTHYCPTHLPMVFDLVV